MFARVSVEAVISELDILQPHLVNPLHVISHLNVDVYSHFVCPSIWSTPTFSIICICCRFSVEFATCVCLLNPSPDI